MAHSPEPDHGKSNYDNLSPGMIPARNSPLAKVRTANAKRSITQVQNQTAALKGYDPESKQAFNHR